MGNGFSGVAALVEGKVNGREEDGVRESGNR